MTLLRFEKPAAKQWRGDLLPQPLRDHSLYGTKLDPLSSSSIAHHLLASMTAMRNRER